MTTLSHVAVVGAGPSGIYVTEKLLALGDIAVDVYERLPAPYGLLRYGVAPDHLKIKDSIKLFHAVLDDPKVRLLANVEVGVDVDVEALRRAYDAVFFTYGASQGRLMGVPGERIPGSCTATEFVNWYNGHPDSEPGQFRLDANSVAVVGMGNVAVDVARILAKSAEELRETDVPPQVFQALEQSKVQDIHVIARRGPAHAKFSLPALMELGGLANADLIIKPSDLELDSASAQLVHDDRRTRAIFETLQRLAETEPQARARRIHLHFLRTPFSVEGADEVTGLLLERMRFDSDGKLRATGFTESMTAQLVVSSVGYKGLGLDGLPFNHSSGTIPNEGGRVIADGATLRGAYVAGWIRRGPQGVLGTNKADANEVVANFAEDRLSLPGRRGAEVSDVDAILNTLAEPIVDWAGWSAVDAAEIALGASAGAARVKINSRAQMLDIARAHPDQENLA